MGTSDDGMAVAASTLTTLCIFFPLLFVRGIAKMIFVPFAVVSTIVLLASLFTALTMTPMMARSRKPAIVATLMWSAVSALPRR